MTKVHKALIPDNFDKFTMSTRVRRKKEKNSCTFSALVEQCLYRCPVSPPSSQAVGHWLYTGLLQPQLAKLGCQSYDKYRQLPRISVNFFSWTNNSDTCLCYKVINTQLYNNKFQELQELLVLQCDQIEFLIFYNILKKSLKKTSAKLTVDASENIVPFLPMPP